ncbi:YaeQ family protein [Pigmentiphaga litoralis]|nr:YaeQ family protein [Pigmentiphaga litoralis]
MALGSVVYKAALQVADMDRHYYADHALVLAQHPSETSERMMVRLLAFALHANEYLVFGQGLSNDEEPDLWIKDLTGAIQLWIEVGLPDEKWVRKACSRADEVIVYAYGRTADAWWAKHRAKLERLDNLTVYRLPVEQSRDIGLLAKRSMQVQCTVQDQEAWLTDGDAAVRVVRETLTPKRKAG